jgi:hypothetical protein
VKVGSTFYLKAYDIKELAKLTSMKVEGHQYHTKENYLNKFLVYKHEPGYPVYKTSTGSLTLYQIWYFSAYRLMNKQ